MDTPPVNPCGRPAGPFHLPVRDVGALRMLAGYQGSAQDGVRSVVQRMGSEFARAVAAELLGWPAAGADAELLAQARADAAWFREDALSGTPRGLPSLRSRAGNAGARRGVARKPKPPP